MKYKIFDGHGDILPSVTEKFKKEEDVWEEKHKPLYEKGNVKAGIFVNFTDPTEKNQKDEFREINDIAVKYFKNRDDFNIVTTGNFVPDKFNLIFGTEGLKPVKTIAHIEGLYDLGYRSFGMTWNEKNDFASGCLEKGGLTELGFELIKLCNETDAFIDLAHANIETFNDVVSSYKKPLFVSHSGVAALLNIPRNLTDEQLMTIKKSNGVVGIFNIPKFLKEDEKEVTISDFVDHIDYVVKLIGIDHVGLGMDFCYYLMGAEGSGTEKLETIGDAQNIVEELESRNYTKEEISKICYKNMERVIIESMKK